MARRQYYILKDGARLYKDTLEAISLAAKREANRIKEPVQVHYEERDAFDRPGRRGPAARHTPTAAGRLAYARNPVNPHLKTAGVELLSFLRGRDITASQAKAIARIAAKAPPKAAARSALPRGIKGAPRAASKDGYNAFLNGDAASDNPYEPGEIGYSMWRTGYLDAKEGTKRNFSRNPSTSNRSEVRSPTSTRSEVRSPTSTKTSTVADTRGNVTVTGGAGDGDTTVNVAGRRPTKASKARKTASNKRGAFVEYIDGATRKRIKYGNKGIATIRAKAMIADGWRGVRVLSA